MLKVLLFSLSIFVGLVAFNNCSGVKFEEATDVASVGDSTGLDAGVPPTVNEAINNCQQAISKGKILEVTKSIRFDDTKVESGRANVCEFNVGDNLGMVNGGMQARYEQQRSISLPTNAVLCDVSLSSPVQNFRYDDVFILTFNNRILASNNRSAIRARLTPERVITKNHSVDIYDYDWLALRGASFPSGADDYCLGQNENLGSCNWPITEQSGQISVSFDKEILTRIGLEAFGKAQIFSLIVTGDNDPSVDCYHQELNLTAKVRYYIQ